MGREVRRVPADWQHPTDGRYKNGAIRYVPMFDKSHAEALRLYIEEDLPAWIEGERLWRVEGKVKHHDGRVQKVSELIAEYRNDASRAHRAPDVPDHEWWGGDIPSPPNPKHYMPDWPAEQRTHYMMYEDTSEGTPISPAFATPEELARWLVDNNASAMGDDTASYEDWLRVARGVPVDLRDYFAAVALPAIVALCAKDTRPEFEFIETMFARRAYEVADAMLRQRMEPPIGTLSDDPTSAD